MYRIGPRQTVRWSSHLHIHKCTSCFIYLHFLPWSSQMWFYKGWAPWNYKQNIVCMDIFMSWKCPFDQRPNETKKPFSGSQFSLYQMPPGYSLVARGSLFSFGCPGLFSGQIPRLSASPPVLSFSLRLHSFSPHPVLSFLTLCGSPSALLPDGTSLQIRDGAG